VLNGLSTVVQHRFQGTPLLRESASEPRRWPQIVAPLTVSFRSSPIPRQDRIIIVPEPPSALSCFLFGRFIPPTIVGRLLPSILPIPPSEPIGDLREPCIQRHAARCAIGRRDPYVADIPAVAVDLVAVQAHTFALDVAGEVLLGAAGTAAHSQASLKRCTRPGKAYFIRPSPTGASAENRSYESTKTARSLAVPAFSLSFGDKLINYAYH
jgi:hypothetical protein